MPGALLRFFPGDALFEVFRLGNIPRPDADPGTGDFLFHVILLSGKETDEG